MSVLHWSMIGQNVYINSVVPESYLCHMGELFNDTQKSWYKNFPSE